jgi:hypothetical protein
VHEIHIPSSILYLFQFVFVACFFTVLLVICINLDVSCNLLRLCLAGGFEQYGRMRDFPRNLLANFFLDQKNLEKLIVDKNFCRHLNKKHRGQFAELLRRLSEDKKDPNKSPSEIFAHLLQELREDDKIFSCLPDANHDVSDSDMSQSFSFMTLDDGLDGLATPRVKTDAKAVISSIDRIELLCLRFDAQLLKSAEPPYDAKCLRTLGFSAFELGNAGFTSDELTKAGFAEAERTSSECTVHESKPGDPEAFSWVVCANQLQQITELMQGLCQKSNECSSPEDAQSSNSFVREDKLPLLMHPETCKVFLKFGLFRSLGDAVEKLISARTFLLTRQTTIEKEHALAMDQAHVMQHADHAVQAIIGMGFEEPQVLEAINCCDGDMEDALNLLTNPDIGQLHLNPISRKGFQTLRSNIGRTARTAAEEMALAHEVKMQQIENLLEQIDVMESMIVLIVQQCAVVGIPSYNLKLITACIHVSDPLTRMSSTECAKA